MTIMQMMYWGDANPIFSTSVKTCINIILYDNIDGAYNNVASIIFADEILWSTVGYLYYYIER